MTTRTYNANVAANSAFAPAQIDFSGIGKIADSYFNAQEGSMKRQAFQEDQAAKAAERERQEQTRQVFSQGIPTGADGQIDYQQMVQRLAPHDPAQATNWATMGNQERERAANRARQERTFNADQSYRNAQLALEREKLATNRKDTSTRLHQLEQLGIDPNSPEGITFLANGKMPADVYKNLAQERKRQATAPHIVDGLNNLNRMMDTYNDASILNSLGPIQGATPDGLLDKAMINTTRLYGELGNWYEGGNSSPNEVRNNIVGATEALAAAIKPMVRGPSEGPWTDADQTRLVAIVGDLAQASNKEEFRRRLNAVRDRVQANFGLDIPFDAFGGVAQPQSDPLAEARDAIARGAPRDQVLKRLRKNGIVPKGL